jgi:hypothetical protein
MSNNTTKSIIISYLIPQIINQKVIPPLLSPPKNIIKIFSQNLCNALENLLPALSKLNLKK